MENILTIGNEYPYGYEKFPAKIFEIGHMSCHKYFDSLVQCLLKRIFQIHLTYELTVGTYLVIRLFASDKN